jgi:hypothetical protein
MTNDDTNVNNCFFPVKLLGGVSVCWSGEVLEKNLEEVSESKKREKHK